jgi:hypothetical protein
MASNCASGFAAAFGGNDATTGAHAPCDSVSSKACWLPSLSKYEPIATHDPDAGQDTAFRLAPRVASAFVGSAPSLGDQAPVE